MYQVSIFIKVQWWLYHEVIESIIGVNQLVRTQNSPKN